MSCFCFSTVVGLVALWSSPLVAVSKSPLASSSVLSVAFVVDMPLSWAE